MNTKGLIAFNELIWIVRIIFVVIVFVMATVVYFYVVNVTFATEGEEMGIFMYRLLYSPTGISQFDPLSGRVYPGVIDIQRLENNAWQESIDFDGEYMAAKLTLQSDGTERVFYYHQQKYDDWGVLASVRDSNIVSIEKSVPVQVTQPSQPLRSGVLTFHVLTPKK